MTTLALKLHAHCKINLMLHINYQMENGYHHLQSIFQRLNLHDILSFYPNKTQNITIKTNKKNLKKKENIVYKTAKYLQSKYKIKQGCHIILKKNIPMGAGLGGGSSNAASTIIALNNLWKIKQSKQELMNIAKNIGADVPFFLQKNNAFVQGIGEKIIPVKLKKCNYILAIPNNTPISTKYMFMHSNLTKNTPIKTMANIKKGKYKNDFQELALNEFPILTTGFNWLNHYGEPKLSGSGSTLFMPYKKNQLQHIIKHKPNNYQYILTSSI